MYTEREHDHEFLSPREREVVTKRNHGPCEQDTDILFSTVFRLKKLNKWNFNDIGLVISKQKSC